MSDALPKAPLSFGAPPPAAAPAAPAPEPAEDFPRARWVEGRLRELPKYCLFFYNGLLDPKLPDMYKEYLFGALYYMLEGGDIIPPEDKYLNGLDELTFAFRCMTELVGRLPAGSLSIYEEVLARDGISLRDRVMEAPKHLDQFFFALGSLYKERVQKYIPTYKNAVKTGMLVKLLQQFLQTWKAPAFTPDRLQHVEAFLSTFKVR